MEARIEQVKTALLNAVGAAGPSMEPRTLLRQMEQMGYGAREVHRAIQAALGRNELGIDTKMQFVIPSKALQAA